MKLIEGMFFPDSDEHFEYHLKANPQFNGAGTYQWTKLKMALDYVPDNRRLCAVDVGAHVGLWSRVLAHKFHQVIAFEPVDELRECFRKNVVADNVELHRAALGSAFGLVGMVQGDLKNSGSWRLDFGGGDQEMTQLDAFDIPRIDFLKIDTEGTELDVIKGGHETIKRSKPYVLVEQKPGHAERYDHAQTEAVSYLKEMGAELYWTKSGDYFLGWK